jgi:hypothetical protein
MKIPVSWGMALGGLRNTGNDLPQHGVTFQKIVISIVTAVRNSFLTQKEPVNSISFLHSYPDTVL